MPHFLYWMSEQSLGRTGEIVELDLRNQGTEGD